jgi:hypothetical protein
MLPVITLIIVLLLPLAIGAHYLHAKLERRKKIVLEHREEVRKIRKIFYKAIDLQFLRTPIIVQTRKEFTYYNKLIVHYKNSTRNVEHIGVNLGEDKTSHSNRIKNYIDKYCNDELEAIKQGQDAYVRYFEELKDRGALNYFKTPYNTEESRAFIYSKIDFLLKNPKAEYGNYKKPSNVVLFE